jgi:hypothetical protein
MAQVGLHFYNLTSGEGVGPKECARELGRPSGT